jgi:cell division protein FtsB
VAAKTAAKKKKSPAARAGLGLAILAVAYFAVQGGEYGTTDLVSQRGRMARLQHEVDSLQRQVDSLARYKRDIETDARVQERLAREEFGMVKGDKEMLYRFADAPAPAGDKR